MTRESSKRGLLGVPLGKSSLASIHANDLTGLAPGREKRRRGDVKRGVGLRLPFVWLGKDQPRRTVGRIPELAYGLPRGGRVCRFESYYGHHL